MDVNALIKTAETMAPADPLRAGPLPDDLATYEDSENPEVSGGWQIETIASADWALCRLAECEAEGEEIERQAEAAIKRIRERAEVLKAKVARGAGFFRYKLAVYAETHRGELLRGKKKSREFLHGAIGWRRTGGRLRVADKDALLAWLAEQPITSGLYRMKLEPEMAAIQSAFKERGEIPPGCEIEPETDEIKITANAPETALAKE